MDSQPDPDIQIAGYRIEARVGRGGMGEVYRAVQLNLGRRVALKVLAPKLAADDVFRRRFLRESRIAASIDHPSIIPIYETGEDGGLLYIAMRYVDGMDLATLLRRDGRLEPARALAIMAQVASALDAAHTRGLVHRDVKPGNILLATGQGGSDGHCYLCDFGLIKEVDAEQAQSALTATDQFVGTIPYVAPEQIEGRDLDGRADVYALGCVLFHCLTGSVPFERMNDIEVVFAHMREPPPSVSSRAPGLPTSIDAIVARAMAKNRVDRWPTCSSMIAAMQPLVRATTPTPATPADDETRSMVMPPAASTPPAAHGLAPSPPPTLPGSPPTLPGSPPTRPGSPAAHGPGTSAQPAGSGSPGRSGPPPTWPDSPPAYAPPPTRPGSPAPPAGRPEDPRSASSPPVGERSRPGGGAPAVVHRGGRGGRRWLVVVAAIVLPVGAYFGTMRFLTEEQPRVVAAPDTTVAPTTRPPAKAKCPGGFTRPESGDATRTPPLAAIRAHMGWTDPFLVDEMRTWRGSDGQRRWYVKAHQQSDPSRRGRWLVGQQEDGQRLVLASARFDTKGYAARDWKVAEGREAPTGVAGCLAGT